MGSHRPHTLNDGIHLFLKVENRNFLSGVILARVFQRNRTNRLCVCVHKRFILRNWLMQLWISGSQPRSQYCRWTLKAAGEFPAQRGQTFYSIQAFNWLNEAHLCYRRQCANSKPTDANVPCGSAAKESTCNAGDVGSTPGLRRFPGKGNGNSLKYSGLGTNFEAATISKIWF